MSRILLSSWLALISAFWLPSVGAKSAVVPTYKPERLTPLVRQDRRPVVDLLLSPSFEESEEYLKKTLLALVICRIESSSMQTECQNLHASYLSTKRVPRLKDFEASPGHVHWILSSLGMILRQALPSLDRSQQPPLEKALVQIGKVLAHPEMIDARGARTSPHWSATLSRTLDRTQPWFQNFVLHADLKAYELILSEILDWVARPPSSAAYQVYWPHTQAAMLDSGSNCLRSAKGVQCENPFSSVTENEFKAPAPRGDSVWQWKQFGVPSRSHILSLSHEGVASNHPEFTDAVKFSMRENSKLALQIAGSDNFGCALLATSESQLVDCWGRPPFPPGTDLTGVDWMLEASDGLCLVRRSAIDCYFEKSHHRVAIQGPATAVTFGHGTLCYQTLTRPKWQCEIGLQKSEHAFFPQIIDRVVPDGLDLPLLRTGTDLFTLAAPRLPVNRPPAELAPLKKLKSFYDAGTKVVAIDDKWLALKPSGELIGYKLSWSDHVIESNVRELPSVNQLKPLQNPEVIWPLPENRHRAPFVTIDGVREQRIENLKDRIEPRLGEVSAVYSFGCLAVGKTLYCGTKTYQAREMFTDVIQIAVHAKGIPQNFEVCVRLVSDLLECFGPKFTSLLPKGAQLNYPGEENLSLVMRADYNCVPVHRVMHCQSTGRDSLWRPLDSLRGQPSYGDNQIVLLEEKKVRAFNPPDFAPFEVSVRKALGLFDVQKQFFCLLQDHGWSCYGLRARDVGGPLFGRALGARGHLNAREFEIFAGQGSLAIRAPHTKKILESYQMPNGENKPRAEWPYLRVELKKPLPKMTDGPVHHCWGSQGCLSPHPPARVLLAGKKVRDIRRWKDQFCIEWEDFDSLLCGGNTWQWVSAINENPNFELTMRASPTQKLKAVCQAFGHPQRRYLHCEIRDLLASFRTFVLPLRKNSNDFKSFVFLNEMICNQDDEFLYCWSYAFDLKRMLDLRNSQEGSGITVSQVARFPRREIRGMSASKSHLCLLRTSREPLCFGRIQGDQPAPPSEDFGQTQIPADLPELSAIFAGPTYSCGQSAKGWHCWGSWKKWEIQ